MKDYSTQFHKPKRTRHWTNQARAITEGVIIAFFLVSLLTLISWVL